MNTGLCARSWKEGHEEVSSGVIAFHSAKLQALLTQFTSEAVALGEQEDGWAPGNLASPVCPMGAQKSKAHQHPYVWSPWS